MKKALVLTFLAAFLSNTAAFAQAEEKPIKGTIPFLNLRNISLLSTARSTVRPDPISLSWIRAD